MRQLRIARAGVFHLGAEAVVLANVLEVLVLIAGVDAQQVVRIGDAVHQQIVHKRARRGHQPGILRLAVAQVRGIVRGDVLHQVERARPAHLDLAHVADVKQARGGARGHVLADDAGILHRHVPAAEVHHFGAQAAMHRMQRGLAKLRRRGSGHEYFLCDSGEKFKLARAPEKCQESRRVALSR